MRLDTTPFVDVSDDLNELAEQVHIEGGGPPKARRRRRRRRDAGSGGQPRGTFLSCIKTFIMPMTLPDAIVARVEEREMKSS